MRLLNEKFELSLLLFLQLFFVYVCVFMRRVVVVKRGALEVQPHSPCQPHPFEPGVVT